MSNKDAMLDLLSDGKWHTNRELLKVAGFAYNARKAELRGEGWMISPPRRIKDGLFAYRLEGRNYDHQ